MTTTVHIRNGDSPPAPIVPPGNYVQDRPRTLGHRSLDERLTVWGAAFGSLALIWVLYERVLPLNGVLGFVVCWYAAFLCFYTGLTAMAHPRIIVIDRLAQAIVTGGAAVVGIALLATILFTFARGWRPLVHVNFYTHDMGGVQPTDPLTKGGVLHALAGSGIELAIATAVSLPLGIGAAIYMSEVGGSFSRIVRTVVEAMTALPDLLAGLFVYTTLLLGLGLQKSGLAAAIALSITMMPIIARSAELALRVVPGGLREAGLALGSTQWGTTWRVVLPTAAPGLATALILAVARAVGETAPVLITSGASSFLNLNPVNNPMNSLPLFIYDGFRSGQPIYIQRSFAAASLLLIIVLVVFVILRLLARSRGGQTR
jgi:phosphate transport system permease protein